MEQKLNLDCTDVVIGSHTLPEYKFQVCNFMNMLYDNINHSDEVSCMTVDVVAHNLKFEIDRVNLEEKEMPSLPIIDNGSTIDLIKHLVKEIMKDGINPIEKKQLIKTANQLWNELLAELTQLYGLKYTVNILCETENQY